MAIFLADVTPWGSPTVEADEYVPVTITWPGYLRLSDSPKSMMLDAGGCLLEVKTDRSSGELVELIVVDARRRDLVQEPAPLGPPAFESGTPCLDVQEAEEGITGPSVSRLHPNGLDVSLTPEDVTRWVGDSRCVLGFSPSGELARMVIRLDPADVRLAFS